MKLIATVSAIIFAAIAANANPTSTNTAPAAGTPAATHAPAPTEAQKAEMVKKSKKSVKETKETKETTAPAGH